MALVSCYRSIYLGLGRRPLDRPRRGYDASRAREKRGGPPSEAVVTRRALGLLVSLEEAWTLVQGLQGRVLKVTES